MKRLLKSYTSFNKTERAGLAGLLGILFLLIVFRISLSYFFPVKSNDLKRQQILAKWQGIKKNKVSGEQISGESPVESTQINNTQIADNQQKTHTNTSTEGSELFLFDPNILDSQGFRKLGLKPKTTSLLIRWRSKGKVFRHKEELRKLYTLTEEEYLRLEPYISLPSTTQPRIKLNSADSAELVGINGIGPKLAHKIVEYRKKNGPFKSYDQLYEVYRFPDSVFQHLSRELTLN